MATNPQVRGEQFVRQHAFMEAVDSIRFMYATVCWRQEKRQIRLAGVAATRAAGFTQAKACENVTSRLRGSMETHDTS
jgi:hypothetical protein